VIKLRGPVRGESYNQRNTTGEVATIVTTMVQGMYKVPEYH